MSEIGICSDCKSMPMIHVGNLIKAELERQGRSKVWFAAAINRSESVCYTILKKPYIDTDMLATICEVLNHDFFKDLSDGFRNEKQ